MGGRTTPFHCPFCGETDLYPHAGDSEESREDAWECRGCLRVFAIDMMGLARPSTGAGSGEQNRAAYRAASRDDA